jgi:hypothetical protein
MKSERDGINALTKPSGTGCVECLATGGWWLQLRRCAECGHIGCWCGQRHWQGCLVHSDARTLWLACSSGLLTTISKALDEGPGRVHHKNA